jgi:hypothetical protein
MGSRHKNFKEWMLWSTVPMCRESFVFEKVRNSWPGSENAIHKMPQPLPKIPVGFGIFNRNFWQG